MHCCPSDVDGVPRSDRRRRCGDRRRGWRDAEGGHHCNRRPGEPRHRAADPQGQRPSAGTTGSPAPPASRLAPRSSLLPPSPQPCLSPSPSVLECNQSPLLTWSLSWPRILLLPCSRRRILLLPSSLCSARHHANERRRLIRWQERALTAVTSSATSPQVMRETCAPVDSRRSDDGTRAVR